MKLSIVVPVYNVEKYLVRCLDSLLGQTYKNIEIILVDDGSTDSSSLICDKYKEQDNRISVIHKENGGLSDARNVGLRNSTGDYVIFVDSDDYIEIDSCEKIAPFLKSGAEVFICDCNVNKSGYAHEHYKNLKIGKEYNGAEYLKKALQKRKFPVMAWLNIYRRDFLVENNLIFKKGILHEDIEFTPRMFLKAKSVVYTGIVFYNYVINDSSITSNKNKTKHCRDIYSTCIHLNALIKDFGDNKLRKLLEDYLVSCYLGIFRAGKMYKYGKEYVHKKYVLKYSHSFKIIIQSLIFLLSPKLFCIL